MWLLLLSYCTVLVSIAIVLYRFQRELKNFFSDMFSANPNVSSTRFVTVTCTILCVATSCAIALICTYRHSDIPGGAAELLVGLVIFLVTGNVGRAYVATKESPKSSSSGVTTTTEERKVNNATTGESDKAS